ncbi:hypothetical protein J7T55_002779 [Diaporthe amygdali]|uniref:uncharacterized protein n=1 Tax=Phomopsis amygdali TaxID=1214568 RepID=UPI0022FE8BE9|nr:uncharacterized protein J7T55_002779 [Diaporthe amygdali]KAJ0122267.1 hypothetical protein J7T55_002779 [Diaporthe amygdali]
MLTRTKLLAAASLLLGAASALPPLVTPVLEARAPAATDPWVSVDTSGTPVTVTPVVTVVDGATTTISPAPNDLTATVVTRTDYAEITTSTGTAPPEPTATNKDGSGSFMVCNNADGVNAPFCQPSQNSSLYPGTTYYVTWDTSVFNSTNTTVILEGSYINATTGEIASQAFSSDKITAGWSYYAWAVDSKLMQGKSGVNITLFLNALDVDQNTTAKSYKGPTVLVTKTPTYHQAPPKMPTGAALYIGLPTVLGFCVVMIFGVCLWNRKARKIAIGNIMSRSRHGYGIAKGRAKRLGRRDKKAAIRLMDQLPEDQHYRDEPQYHSARADDDGWGQQHVVYHHHQQNNNEFLGHARRDSDALGSLAGTPTSAHFPSTQPPQGGNAFREELERQQRERS